MESFLVDALMKGIVSAGIPCIMLGFAVFWFHKQWVRQTAIADAERVALAKAESERRAEERAEQKEFIEALNKERSDRISIVEAHNVECEKDRFKLREDLIALLKENRTIVREVSTNASQS